MRQGLVTNVNERILSASKEEKKEGRCAWPRFWSEPYLSAHREVGKWVGDLTT